MLRNLFGSKGRTGSKETWEDRAKAHKMALRATQGQPVSKSDDSSDDRPRRGSRASARDSSAKGFGKRGS